MLRSSRASVDSPRCHCGSKIRVKVAGVDLMVTLRSRQCRCQIQLMTINMQLVYIYSFVKAVTACMHAEWRGPIRKASADQIQPELPYPKKYKRHCRCHFLTKKLLNLFMPELLDQTLIWFIPVDTTGGLTPLTREAIIWIHNSITEIKVCLYSTCGNLWHFIGIMKY